MFAYSKSKNLLSNPTYSDIVFAVALILNVIILSAYGCASVCIRCFVTGIMLLPILLGILSKYPNEEEKLIKEVRMTQRDTKELANTKLKDIEDETERFVHLFTEERNSDVVKKINMRKEKTTFYLISLIEHKSEGDYNVVMQIFRYMAFDRHT